jgi:hypothetical protein
MKTSDRRAFLSALSCSLASIASAPALTYQHRTRSKSDVGSSHPHLSESQSVCWLDVCAPFIIEDLKQGISSELVLTSDNFAGVRGHEEKSSQTAYEIFLYDEHGKLAGGDVVTRRLTVAAMQTTVIPIRQLIGDTQQSFRGGMKVRLHPQCPGITHAGDLFSSAFIRWKAADSFDNVHANPDPQQWQNQQAYYYSMPLPSLAEYQCQFSLFNPYNQTSKGDILAFDANGKRILSQRYELKPHCSVFVDLNQPGISEKVTGGLLAVANHEGTAKGFGYLMIRQPQRKRFSVEHPIHSSVFKPAPAIIPFDKNNQFRAKNVLYSPLLFRARKIAGLTLQSRVHLGAGLPLEEAQWFYPFAIDGDGNADWSSIKDETFARQLPETHTQNGVVRLKSGQSCLLDFQRASLPDNFSGGLGVAVAPDISHTMLKLELRVPEWNAFAFTHFRPGLRSARNYQRPAQRGGLATDYIVSGAHLLRQQAKVILDEIIGIINIDDQGIEDNPVIEVFGASGLLHRLTVGNIPAFSCRHFLLSELLKTDSLSGTLSLRLVAQKATLLMSVIHLDYERRDLAMDHGSDRFSTYLDYSCQ